MQQSELLIKVQEIFRDVLENDEIVLNPQTTANDVDDWDSLNHIQLIVAIEKAFGIKFNSKEILSWNNVGEMLACIATKN